MQGSHSYLLLTKKTDRTTENGLLINNFKIPSMFVDIFIFCPQILITKINFIQVKSEGWQS